MPAGMLEQDNMVSAKGILPWHGLGVVVPDEGLLTADAIRLAGLDWTVRTEPITYNGVEIGKELGQFVIREDTNTPLGIVKGRYELVQNATCFNMVDSLFERHPGQAPEAIIETAGSLYNGKRVFIVANRPKDLKIAGDDYGTYLVLMTSHDGSCSIMAMWSLVRVVCANTWASALGSAKNIYKIRHTRNYEIGIQEVKRLLGLGDTFYAQAVTTAEKMLQMAFPKAKWDALTEQLFAVKAEDGLEPAKAAITRANNSREDLTLAYYADDLDNVRHTAWGALQACIDFSDHGRTVKVTQKTSALERGFIRAFEDTDFKNQAMEKILALA